MKREGPVVYPDASVLIAYAEGNESALRLFRQLTKARASFVTSNLLELETVPSTLYAGRRAANATLVQFFQRWKPRKANAATIELAATECARLPLGSMDALHLAAAHQAGATMFVTLEKRTKPMHRSRMVAVVHVDQVF